MSYYNEFWGQFELDKELSDEMFDFLKSFNKTRRVVRNVSSEFGVEGEFFVEENPDTVIDYNTPPSTQPGLWCQWTPTEDGKGIEWDGGDDFYCHAEWIVYLVNKILAPNGYVLNGTVHRVGEEEGDKEKIIVKNNKIYVKFGRLAREEITVTSEMKPEIVLKFS
jgi:hypothetical protein